MQTIVAALRATLGLHLLGLIIVCNGVFVRQAPIPSRRRPVRLLPRPRSQET